MMSLVCWAAVTTTKKPWNTLTYIFLHQIVLSNLTMCITIFHGHHKAVISEMSCVKSRPVHSASLFCYSCSPLCNFSPTFCKQTVNCKCQFCMSVGTALPETNYSFLTNCQMWYSTSWCERICLTIIRGGICLLPNVFPSFDFFHRL